MDAITLLLAGILAFQILHSLTGIKHMSDLSKLNAAVAALQASDAALATAVNNAVNNSDQAGIDSATAAVQSVQQSLDQQTTSLGGTPPAAPAPVDAPQAV